ncbi:MAG: hypothetical protein E7224_04540 [Clostridiales bacterium]|nr:hypothetical protein [Clostridiales bacterium]
MKKSRIFFITCCTLLVLLFGLCSVAYAADVPEELTFEETVCQALREKVEKPMIDVSAYEFYLDPETMTCEALSEAYTAILNNHPDLFYVNGRYGYSYRADDGDEDFEDGDWQVLYFFPEYCSYIPYEDLSEIVAEFDAKVDEVFYSVWDKDMSDEDVALAFHDWLVLNCEYDWDNYVASTVPDESYSAYGTFMEGTAVCQGYALAYDLLLGKAGIETKYVTSDAMDHGWSLVHIGDHWYHVDVTWDDPVTDRPGRVSHDYFLVSGKQFAEQNVDSNPNYYDHYGWDPSFDLLCGDGESPCDDDTYTCGAYPFNHSEDSPFYYVDGKFWYYLNDDQDGPSLIVSAFDGSNVSCYAPDDEYVIDSIYGEAYARKFSGLLHDGREFYLASLSQYINLPAYILRYDCETNSFTELHECADKGSEPYYDITGLALEEREGRQYLKWQMQDYENIGGSLFPDGDLYWSDPIILSTLAEGEVEKDGTLTLTFDPHFFQQGTACAMAAIYSEDGHLLDLVSLSLEDVTKLQKEGLHGTIYVRLFEMAANSYAPQTDADPIDFDID